MKFHMGDGGCFLTAPCFCFYSFGSGILWLVRGFEASMDETVPKDGSQTGRIRTAGKG